MTYLVENEQAALVVPARFLGRIHPHFREVVQLLAMQVADEARHVEVFTRRARLHRDVARVVWRRRPGLAADAARRARLHARVVPAVGAGRRHVPRPAVVPRAPRARPGDAPGRAAGAARTRRATSRSGSRTSSIASRTSRRLRAALRAAIERRHDALRDTAGLNDDVFDALVVLAAGALDPQAHRARLASGAATSRRTWTTAASAASCGSASPHAEAAEPLRPPHPQLHVSD